VLGEEAGSGQQEPREVRVQLGEDVLLARQFQQRAGGVHQKLGAGQTPLSLRVGRLLRFLGLLGSRLQLRGHLL